MSAPYPEVAARAALAAHPAPLLFVSVCGAHLYGFPSPDSDLDLRGVHVLPVRRALGLTRPSETVERSETVQGVEIDLVTHDVRKFLELAVVKRSGNPLEALFSPLPVQGDAERRALAALVHACLTSEHAAHYRGFARREHARFLAHPTLKRALYVYRVALTGVHLLHTGTVLPHLPTLAHLYALPHLHDWIAAKGAGAEHGLASEAVRNRAEADYPRLVDLLAQALEHTALPAEPPVEAVRAVEEYVVSIRLRGSLERNQTADERR